MTAFISIFLIKVLTNYLSIDEYGLYSKIYNYLSIFAVIADLGLYTITIREISENKDDKSMVQKIIWNMLTIRMSLWLLIILFSVWVAFFLPGYNTKLALVAIFIASIFTLFGLLDSAIRSLLQAYLKTEFSFISTTVWRIVNFVTILLIAFIIFPESAIQSNPDLRFWAFVAVMISGLIWNIVMTAMIYNYSKKVEKISLHFDWDYIKHLFKISLPYGIALFLNVIYFKVDIVLLSVLEPRAIADRDIALYGVPMKIVEVGMMFGTLFLNSMLPLFTESIKKKEKEKLLDLIGKAYKSLAFLGIWIVAYLFAHGKEVITLISTSDYLNESLKYNSLDAYNIVIFIFFAYFISSIFTYLLIANNEQSKLLKVNLIITTFNLIGNIIFIPYFSFFGSAIITLISQFLLLGFTYYYTHKLAKFNFLPKFSLIAVLIWILAWSASFLFLQNVHLPIIIEVAISSCIFGVIYLWLFFGLLGRGFLEIILKKMKKWNSEEM